jgi:hypothetical protein
VYKEGYTDFIIFYIMIRENHLRDGPRILLFPASNDTDGILHTLIESPDDDWAKAVRDKYKKADTPRT